MSHRFRWTADRMIDLAIWNKTHTIEMMAVKFRVSSETVRMQLKRMGLPPMRLQKKRGQRATPPAKPKECYVGRFEDHPNADRDRLRGPKPKRAATEINRGTAASECCG